MPHPSPPEAPHAHDAATSTAPLVGPASPPAPVIGWDVGGAHVKASLLEGGTVTAIEQWATPLWTGLEHLDAAIEAARARWPAFAHARHAVTMTAEMTDLFPDREAGVRALCDRLADRLGAATRFYAGVDTGVEPVTSALRDLAERCAAAVPGLAGFVGLDLVRQPDGRLCIIEINPRLTCAYAGLAAPRPEPDKPPSPARPRRNLAADIIAAHDAALSNPSTETADAPIEHA